MKTHAQLTPAQSGLVPRLLATAGVYFRLTKPKINLLLLISAAAGLLAAGGGSIDWLLGATVLAGGYLCSGGAGAMNCYLDRELDLAMARTRHRPLPSGQVTPRNALIFSIAISLLSIPLFLSISPLVAALGIVAWLYYVVFYGLYLKQRTHHNIVIGGTAGAFPPLIGWVAVSGNIDLSAILLFLIVFFWTPPHAYALMLIVKEEYKGAGIPMLPVVLGDRETARQILLYSILLLVLTAAPGVLGVFGPVYLATAIALGALLVILSVGVYRYLDRVWAMRVFRYSSLYLALLFLGLVIDRALFIGA